MPRPFSSVLSLPFWQDRKEGYPTQTITRMKGYVVLSKHEVTAIACKIYRLAPTVNPPLDGGPAVLHTAGGCQGGNPLGRSLPSFCRHRKKGPAGQALEEMPFKITEKGMERNEPPQTHHIPPPAPRMTRTPFSSKPRANSSGACQSVIRVSTPWEGTTWTKESSPYLE